MSLQCGVAAGRRLPCGARQPGPGGQLVALAAFAAYAVSGRLFRSGLNHGAGARCGRGPGDPDLHRQGACRPTRALNQSAHGRTRRNLPLGPGAGSERSARDTEKGRDAGPVTVDITVTANEGSLPAEVFATLAPIERDDGPQPHVCALGPGARAWPSGWRCWTHILEDPAVQHCARHGPKRGGGPPDGSRTKRRGAAVVKS